MLERPIQKVSYPLRMPDGLREELESAAKKGGRSLHAEIVARLESSFSKTATDDSLALVIRLERQIAETEKESHRHQIQALLLSREIKRFTSLLPSDTIDADSNLKDEAKTLLHVANFIQQEIEDELKKQPGILDEIAAIGKKAMNWLLKPF